MKTERKELKMRARRALSGNYGVMIFAALIQMGVSWALSLVIQSCAMGGGLMNVTLSRNGFRSWGIPVYLYVILALLELAATFIAALLSSGMIRMSLCLSDKGSTDLSEILWAFKNRPMRYVLLYVLAFVLVMICLIPFLVLTAVLALAMESFNYGQALFAVVFMVMYLILFTAGVIAADLNFGMIEFVFADDPEIGLFQGLAKSYHMMKGNRIRYLALEWSFVGLMLLSSLTLGIGGLWVFTYVRTTMAMFYLDIRPAGKNPGIGSVSKMYESEKADEEVAAGEMPVL